MKFLSSLISTILCAANKTAKYGYDETFGER